MLPKCEVLDARGIQVSAARRLLKKFIAQKKGRSAQNRAPDNSHLSDVAFQGLRDLVLRHSADDLLNNLTVLENQQRRNAANIESAR